MEKSPGTSAAIATGKRIKKVDDLEPGDFIQTEKGPWVEVTEVTNGIFTGHLRIDFRFPDGNTGWGQLPHTSTVYTKTDPVQ